MTFIMNRFQILKNRKINLKIIPVNFKFLGELNNICLKYVNKYYGKCNRKNSNIIIENN